MIFLLRWTIVPTARLPPAFSAQSGCLLSINSQLLPVKFKCPAHLHPHSFQFLQEASLSYLRILRNCCRLAIFANSPWTLSLVWREGVEIFTGSNGEELELICNICSVQQSDKLMIPNQDFFPPWWGRDFIPFWRRGSVSFSLILMAVFEAKKAGNIGIYHLARALE